MNSQESAVIVVKIDRKCGKKELFWPLACFVGTNRSEETIVQVLAASKIFSSLICIQPVHSQLWYLVNWILWTVWGALSPGSFFWDSGPQAILEVSKYFCLPEVCKKWQCDYCLQAAEYMQILYKIVYSYENFSWAVSPGVLVFSSLLSFPLKFSSLLTVMHLIISVLIGKVSVWLTLFFRT